jgi:hypothetical protein
MLLLDDHDELPTDADEAEIGLMAQLGATGLARIDDNLLKHTHNRRLKVARVVADAVQGGGFPISDESLIRLHVRRLQALVESGALEAEGDLRKPRWSEVRVAPAGRASKRTSAA